MNEIEAVGAIHPVLPQYTPAPRAPAEPTAQVAASAEIARGVLPSVPSQAAEVTRAMLGAVAEGDSTAEDAIPPAKEPERVLKPWGVMMLPDRQDEAAPDPATSDAQAGEEAGEEATEPAKDAEI